MINAENILEFNRVKECLAGCCLTRQAKQKAMALEPFMSENRLLAEICETSEAKKLIERLGNPPLAALEGIKEIVGIAAKGGCLSGEQLEILCSMLAAIKRLKSYLANGKQYNVGLAYYDENLDYLEAVQDAIRMQIRNGRVDDYASKLLKTLREDISKTETKMREKADSVMRANAKWMSDGFSTIRNGRLCVPVKKEYKQHVKGAVIDKSSTGNTLFIEPEAVGRYFEELQLLKLDEENEERRILYCLTAMIFDSADIINRNIEIIEKLDFIFAKGKYSLEYGGTEPKINTERKIVLKNGRHPLMDRKVNVPLQFEIGGRFNGVIITGPNTGGKTVAIKTVALNCMMAQSGLHVACDEADICMNNAFLCDIGDGQNLYENLSTFSAHISNVLDILRRVNSESLVVLDELGSGTDPAEGMGIAIAILEELKKSGALFLVTTHYPEVKTYAERAEGIVNARMAFDKESLKPLYKLIIGEAGESCAFYIAGRLGMPETMLKRAELAAYGKYTETDYLKKSEETGSFKPMPAPKIEKINKYSNKQKNAMKYHLGDSVMVYPDKKIGIVCKKADEKGVLRIQMADKKIWINHKRIKLLVAADKLYPEDYDFSIIFETARQRKIKHDMDRKYVEDIIEYSE